MGLLQGSGRGWGRAWEGQCRLCSSWGMAGERVLWPEYGKLEGYSRKCTQEDWGVDGMAWCMCRSSKGEITFPDTFPIDFPFGKLVGKVTNGNHMTIATVISASWLPSIQIAITSPQGCSDSQNFEDWSWLLNKWSARKDYMYLSTHDVHIYFQKPHDK